MTTRRFHISDILSISTGRLLSTQGMDGIYRIMGYLVNDETISTIGLAAQAEAARAWLEQDLPWVLDCRYLEPADGAGPDAVMDHVLAFLTDCTQRYGAEHAVRPIPDPPDVGVLSHLAYVLRRKG